MEQQGQLQQGPGISPRLTRVPSPNPVAEVLCRTLDRQFTRVTSWTHDLPTIDGPLDCLRTEYNGSTSDCSAGLGAEHI